MQSPFLFPMLSKAEVSWLLGKTTPCLQYRKVMRSRITAKVKRMFAEIQLVSASNKVRMERFNTLAKSLHFNDTLVLPLHEAPSEIKTRKLKDTKLVADLEQKMSQPIPEAKL